MSDDKDSDEIYQKDKNDEERQNIDIKVFKLGKICFAEKYRQFWEIILWRKWDGYDWWRRIW